MKHLQGILILCIATILNLASAEERIELEETTVTGNRELPRITHIVPWQTAQLPAPEPPPLDRLIDEALTPLDRDEFRRGIRYYYELSSTEQAAGE